MSKAFDLSQAGRGRGITADLGAYRNKIINGDFDIWQRGDSFSIPSAQQYTADRWCVGAATGAATGAARGAFSVGQSVIPGGASGFLQITRSAAANAANTVVFQRIDNVRLLQGKKVTITFYGHLPAGKELTLTINQGFGAGGSSTVNLDVGTLVGVGGWNRYQFAFDVPSISGKTLGSGHSMQISFNEVTALSTFLFSLAHVSVVEGDATAEDDPFSPRHIQQELALCQRYYQVNRSRIRYDAGASGHQISIYQPLIVPMRAQPTITTTTIVSTNISVGTITGLTGVNVVAHQASGAASGACDSVIEYRLDAEL